VERGQASENGLKKKEICLRQDQLEEFRHIAAFIIFFPSRNITTDTTFFFTCTFYDVHNMSLLGY
jgi:hypothetical protein